MSTREVRLAGFGENQYGPTLLGIEKTLKTQGNGLDF
jgi:hypothetical protein